MAVTDTQIAALRAFLIHDADAMMHLAYQLGEGGMQDYVRLAEAALSVAALRRFAPSFTSADVVQFVASVRVARTADGDEYELDPVLAERVLRHVLGQQDQGTLELESWLRTVIALLDAFADAELSTLADVDELLAEARALADWWLAADHMRRGRGWT
jgi:hypothetical protein